MERQPQRPEGDDNQPLWGGEDVIPVEVEPGRARRIIEGGIEWAAAAGEVVDDWVARHIALQLKPSEGSPLEVFTRTGEIAEGFAAELVRGYDRQRGSRQLWIDFLGTYALHREDHGPVERWEARAHIRDLFDRAWRIRSGPGGLYQERLQIGREIRFAQDARQLIDAQLAMRIMVQLAASPHSALARFVAEGEMTDDLVEELRESYASGNNRTRQWLEELGSWAAAKGATLPVPYWRSASDPIPPTPDEPVDEAADETRRAARLEGLEERLAPLPDLGEIPPPPSGHAFDSGYGWMAALPEGWYAEPSWGRDGWDLGAWPLIVVALFTDDERELYAVAAFVEHGVTVQRYRSRGALNAAVNDIAEFHWRLGQAQGPRDLPEGNGLRAHHAGPYSRARLARERPREEVQEPEDHEQ